MKLFIKVVLVVMLFSGKLVAQDFQGMAVYESKTNISDFKSKMGDNKNFTPEMQKMIEERMQKMFDRTFILNFNKSASVYKKEEKLSTPGQGSDGGMRIVTVGMGDNNGGTYYKDIKRKSYIVDKELMGKEFLIKDSLPKLDWKMDGETKMIGGYNCFKATAVRSINIVNPGKEKVTDPAKKTNFMDGMDIPKEITITAWYTPEIPVSHGPEGYWGLPGLILEVNDGKTVILCSKVVLNSKEKIEIKPSTNGKMISQKEFDEIAIRKMEEMQNTAKDGMQFRIGG